MSLPRAAGMPDYTASGSGFIPEIWSGKLLIKFYDATVLTAISNTDYEGEIKNHGDKVKIRTVPDITIRDYIKGQALTSERPESDPLELLIDKGKYFNFVIDDVDAYQADIKLMDKWSTDASEQMKIKIDTEVLAAVGAQVSAENKGATAGRKSAAFDLGASAAPVQITKTNVLDYLVDCGTVLDEQNIPETGRFVVIPAWMAGLIKKSDLKDASLTGDGTSVLRNGRIGMIDRFELFSSNNIKVTVDGVNCYDVLFGHSLGLTFASQITKTETLRAESTFGDIIRGLNVYGFKVLKEQALGLLYARK